jgi:hypothetical protein
VVVVVVVGFSIAFTHLTQMKYADYLISFKYWVVMSRGSSVTSDQTTGWMTVVRFPAGAKKEYFSLSYRRHRL